MAENTLRAFANRAVKLPMKARYYRLWFDLQRILDYQHRFLLRTVRGSRGSLYGQEHNFSTIQTVKDFQYQVPLSDYDTLAPYIDRMLKGEQNVLTSNQVNRFAKSAGTTSASSKFVPVTDEALEYNHFKASKDFMSMYMENNWNSGLLKGLGMILSGSLTENPYTDEKNIGFISAILAEETPRYGSYFTALDESYTAITDWNEKMDKVVKEFHDKNITSISGVAPWIVLLAKKLEEYCGKSVQEIWPDFELILSGGVNIDLYIDQYRELFGDQVNIYNIYNASEGFYGFQTRNDDHTLLLATNHAIFYEFIPIDEFDGKASSPLTLDEVTTGQDYALVITNNAGLRRYITGDTIRFVARNPFKIEVTGRIKYALNAFGEQVYLDHVVKTIKEVSALCNCCVKEYTVAPARHTDREGGYHEWIIEWTTPPDDREKFEQLIDQRLQENSYYYRDKRTNDTIMTKPKFHYAQAGLFYDRFEKHNRLGGQSKVPNLWNERTYLDELLEMIDEQ